LRGARGSGLYPNSKRFRSGSSPDPRLPLAKSESVEGRNESGALRVLRAEE
jgi:hypothetical protein